MSESIEYIDPILRGPTDTSIYRRYLVMRRGSRISPDALAAAIFHIGLPGARTAPRHPALAPTQPRIYSISASLGMSQTEGRAPVHGIRPDEE